MSKRPNSGRSKEAQRFARRMIRKARELPKTRHEIFVARPAFTIPNADAVQPLTTFHISSSMLDDKLDDDHDFGTRNVREACVLIGGYNLEPMYVDSIIDTKSVLSRTVAIDLEKEYGVYLDATMLDCVESAIRRLVTTVALDAQLVAPKELLAYLVRAEQATQNALDILSFMEAPDKSISGIDYGIGLNEAVPLYLKAKCGIDILDLHNLRKLNAEIASAVASIRPLASKRSSKPALAYKLFLALVTSAAKELGLPTQLPSNSIREDLTDVKPTPFVRFVHGLLKQSKRLGDSALGFLPAGERREVLKVLAKYAAEKPANLANHLRQARRTHYPVRDQLGVAKSVSVTLRDLPTFKSGRMAELKDGIVFEDETNRSGQ